MMKFHILELFYKFFPGTGFSFLQNNVAVFTPLVVTEPWRIENGV